MTAAPGTIALRATQEDGSCDHCKRVKFKSAFLRSDTFLVARQPDVVLVPDDVALVIPLELDSTSIPDSAESLWRATLLLTPEAERRVAKLKDDRQGGLVLAFSDAGPIGVVPLASLGRSVSLGEFRSMAQLKKALEPFATIEDATVQRVEVFSDTELDSLREADRVIDRSEKLARESAELERLFQEGRISKEEMVERLGELGD